MITTEQAITAIRGKLDKLTKITTSHAFDSWQMSTLSTLRQIYIDKDILSKFDAIESSRWIVNHVSDRLDRALVEAKEYLEGLIEDLDILGMQTSEKSGFAINVNQTSQQTQTVSINIDIVYEALKDELGRKKITELIEILNADEDEKEKKKSFMEKIKSFGADVSSNVLATILTNPQVFEQLGGLLGK